MRLWTPSEIGFLRSNYDRMSNPDIGSALGRSPNSIQTKAARLGLSKSTETRRRINSESDKPQYDPWPDRFWNKVERGSGGGCWIWGGYTTRFGYGRLRLPDRRLELAHRVAWVLCVGAIPTGAWVLHHCDNPPCVNPKHLYLGDAQNNIDDAVERDRLNPYRGAHHPSAKLAADQVRDIRRLYDTGDYSLAQLGRRYGVVYQTISHIVKRKTWTHI